jgi:hypothetical protein
MRAPVVDQFDPLGMLRSSETPRSAAQLPVFAIERALGVPAWLMTLMSAALLPVTAIDNLLLGVVVPMPSLPSR